MGVLTNDDLQKIMEIFEKRREKIGHGYTLSEWAHHWFETYKSSSISQTTHKNYVSFIRRHIDASIIADKLLCEITTEDLQSMINKLHKKGYSRTIKLLYDSLKNMFKIALSVDEINKNIAETLILPKSKQKERIALTDDEIAVLKNVNTFTLQEKAYVYIALFTGLRRGEILALTAKDIDFENNTLSVNKTLIFPHNKGILKLSPKTAAGNRIIPLPFAVKSVLRYLITPNTNFLFSRKSFDGEIYFSQQAFRRFWHNIIKKAEKYNYQHNKVDFRSDKITSHCLRHTYATMLYYADIGIKDAQRLLGHSSIRMTMDIYTHLRDDRAKVNAIIKKIDSYVANNVDIN